MSSKKAVAKTVAPYTHRETPIYFDPTFATFACSVNGQRLTAPSLDAIKKKIDKTKAETVEFAPFNCLEYSRVSEYTVRGEKSADKVVRSLKLEKGRVVSIESERNKYGGGKFRFAVETGERGSSSRRSTVVVDTPEARAAIAHYYEIAVRNEMESQRLEAEIEAARLLIPHLNADDYVTGKVKP